MVSLVGMDRLHNFPLQKERAWETLERSSFLLANPGDELETYIFKTSIDWEMQVGPCKINCFQNFVGSISSMKNILRNGVKFHAIPIYFQNFPSDRTNDSAKFLKKIPIIL